MTEEQRTNFAKCERWHGCSASVCLLDQDIEHTYYITGDKRCTKILDYLEGQKLPEDLRLAIEATEPIWRKVLGEALLGTWVKGRNRMRKYFQNAV